MDRRSFIAIAASSGVGVYLWKPWQQEEDLRVTDYPKWCINEGQRRYATLNYTALKGQSAESLTRLLSPRVAETQSEPGAPESDAAPLMASLAEFLYFRFCQTSPAAYRAWRTQQGYLPRTMEDLTRNPHAMPEAFATMVGRPLGEHAKFEESFDAIFAPALDYSKGLNRPARIAAGDGGLAILFRSMPPDGDPERPRVSGTIPADLWRGLSAANATSWWSPPVSLASRDHRPAPDAIAEVGLIIEYADQSRYPTQSRWLYAASVRRWFIDVWTISNFPLGLGLSSADY